MSVKIKYIGTPIVSNRVMKGHVPLRKAVQERLEPSPRLLNLIGEELVRGYRGGAQAINMTVGPEGGISLSRGTPYPTGIKRGRSPDGSAYQELSKKRITTKRNEGMPRPTAPLIGWGDLMDGLAWATGPNSVTVYFHDQDTNAKSRRMESGGNFKIPYVTKGGDEGLTKPIAVPARPHRDIQPAVLGKVQLFLKRWVEGRLG